jgi:hypothetical protein
VNNYHAVIMPAANAPLRMISVPGPALEPGAALLGEVGVADGGA